MNLYHPNLGWTVEINLNKKIIFFEKMVDWSLPSISDMDGGDQIKNKKQKQKQNKTKKTKKKQDPSGSKKAKSWIFLSAVANHRWSIWISLMRGRFLFSARSSSTIDHLKSTQKHKNRNWSQFPFLCSVTVWCREKRTHKGAWNSWIWRDWAGLS